MNSEILILYASFWAFLYVQNRFDICKLAVLKFYTSLTTV
jgi:hypothetical protein